MLVEHLTLIGGMHTIYRHTIETLLISWNFWVVLVSKLEFSHDLTSSVTVLQFSDLEICGPGNDIAVTFMKTR